jgi:putative endonuclease
VSEALEDTILSLLPSRASGSGTSGNVYKRFISSNLANFCIICIDLKGYMYILECADGSYYTGSTKNLDARFAQHQSGLGANHTKKRLPVKLVYFEEFLRIDEAYYREKQVQGWNRKKKTAIIQQEAKKLPALSMAYRDLE